MAHTDIPSTGAAGLRQLERDLADTVDGEVRFDAGTRGAYSTDGSNFRQVPIGVVLPRTTEAGIAAIAACRRHGVTLADGFSCRTQIHELDSGGRDAMHLAELLATAGNLGYQRPERTAAPRPAPPRPAAKAAALAGAAAVLAATATAGAAALLRSLRRAPTMPLWGRSGLARHRGRTGR
jgi:hypothetical protein